MKGNVVSYLDPEYDTLKNVFYEALRRKKVIMILANCEVFYEGRSKSYLEPGDRIIVVKEDRAVLIHRPNGYKPVNWQPSNTEVILDKRNDSVYLFAIRDKPRERVRIKLIKTYLVLTAKLVDAGEFSMYLTEKEMQSLLLRNLTIIEEGLRPVIKEKEIRSGKIDIFARDKNGNYVVIELKKHRIGEREALQLYRYVKELRENNPDIRGIIVGPSIDEKAIDILRSLNLEYKILSPKAIKKMIEKEEKKRKT